MKMRVIIALLIKKDERGGKMNKCKPCYFKCKHEGNKENCPLVKLNDPIAICADVKCKYFGNCDVCVAQKEVRKDGQHESVKHKS